MNYEIVELEEFSAKKAVIYSVLVEGDDFSLFDHFIIKHRHNFQSELKSIVDRLTVISDRTGAREGFFKLNEGVLGDGVCALYDEPDKDLRLYCIRLGSVAIILGGGGPKPPGVRAWQDDPTLKAEAELMIKIARDVDKRFKEGDIEWSEDITYLSGNLKFNENEAD